METYISFRVTTRVKQETSDDTEYIVRRRYNDFIWLRNKLIEAFPTLLVPALPGKHSVIGQLDRYSKQFIMCRMALLHSYLQRLAAHPVFSSSSAFKIFLTAKPAEFSLHSKGGSGIIDKLTGSLQNLAGYLPKSGPVHSEFDNVRQYVNCLSQKLSNIHSIAIRVNKERVDLVYDLEDAKKALRVWSNHEPKLSVIINAIQEAVTCEISLQNTHFIQNCSKQLQQPLEEYVIYVDAVKEALARRDSIQIAFETAIEENNRKKSEKDELLLLENSPNGIGFKLWKSSSHDKMKRLQLEISNLDKLVEDNHDKMEIANEGMRADLDRWNTEKRTEIKVILNKLSDRHIDYYQQVSDLSFKIKTSLLIQAIHKVNSIFFRV
ncbi:hypothetical protein AAG570_008466 [Ranatra chinensis]|uniref:PX domain-containing protein n=1 Tax=Ranatra chinensis TaxID=642074 RepID=A0ABD0Z1R6_9HEMI